MQLFSRTLQTMGPQAEIMAWATDLTAYVNDESDADVSLWAGVIGTPVGSLAWSMRVDGLAGVQSRMATLAGDSAYADKITAARDWVVAPAEDHLLTPLTGELGGSPPVGSMATVTSAVISAGHYAQAVAWGLDVSARVEEVTGIPTIFGMQEFGTFGTCTWIGGSPDAAGVDGSRAALAADDDYRNLLQSATDLFVPGTGHRMLVTRVA